MKVELTDDAWKALETQAAASCAQASDLLSACREKDIDRFEKVLGEIQTTSKRMLLAVIAGLK